MNEFDDIRAYHDDEVNEILLSLIQDPEFLGFLANQIHPRLNRFVPSLVKKKLRRKLSERFENIHNVAAWQKTVAPFVESLIAKTVNTFSIQGLDTLDKDKTYLFISNHRDIAMDPILVNYALLLSGMNTSKVAIGDNLLGRQFVAKLMRLNKSFVVKRSVTARREKLESTQNLSTYIHKCIKSNQHVWIAQKEGRAKDGVDKTDTAVLKMLHMAGRKLGWDFQQSMKFLNIVPVSISYEWDPCDVDKAKELASIATTGLYEKDHDEDFQSIMKGLKGNKGNVTVHFSQPISLESVRAEDWSQAVDNDIYQGYQLHDTNLLAASLLKGETPENNTIYKEWTTRFSGVDASVHNKIIENYAKSCELQESANKK